MSRVRYADVQNRRRGQVHVTHLESAYEYLLEHPPLGLAVQRHGQEFCLVIAPEVSGSIERYRGHRREVGLSRAALEVSSGRRAQVAHHAQSRWLTR
jgi:hypothetical protein